jgi:hypothetical protein
VAPSRTGEGHALETEPVVGPVLPQLPHNRTVNGPVTTDCRHVPGPLPTAFRTAPTSFRHPPELPGPGVLERMVLGEIDELLDVTEGKCRYRVRGPIVQRHPARWCVAEHRAGENDIGYIADAFVGLLRE